MRPWLPLVCLGGVACAPEPPDEEPDPPPPEPSEQAIRFEAVLGGEPAACGTKARDVGSVPTNVDLLDLRLFVSQFEALFDDGTAEPIVLTTDATYQGGVSALLDFENGAGTCRGGTPSTHTAVLGTFRPDAVGLRFTLGLPDDVNQGPITATTQPPTRDAADLLLNDPTGFVALQLELAVPGQGLWPVRLHDVVTSNPGSGVTNRVQAIAVDVELTAFDVATDAIRLDLDTLLSDTNFGLSQQVPTLDGCQMTTGDADCAGIFRHWGLSTGSPDFVFVVPADDE